MKTNKEILTLEELEASHQAWLKKDFIKNPKTYGVDMGGGWRSTSKLTPSKGLIYKDEKKGALVKFRTKYGRILHGIVTCFHVEKGHETIMVQVMSTERGLDGTATNYSLRQKDYVIVKGTVKYPTFDFKTLHLPAKQVISDEAALIGKGRAKKIADFKAKFDEEQEFDSKLAKSMERQAGMQKSISLQDKSYQELAKMVGGSFLGKSKQQLIDILSK